MNVCTIAERLANEGVPLSAIARSLETPAEKVREHLAAARDDGRLLSLPQNDWPVGYPRDERAAELSRLVVADRGALAMSAMQLFALSPAEAELFLNLLRAPVVRRDVASDRTTYVHVCHLRRRLASFGLEIITLWGSGYKLSDPDRRRAMDLILAHT